MFLPPTIDLGNSEKYILSLRIKPTDFMFSLTEPKVGKNYCLRSTKFEEGKNSLLDHIQKIIFELNFLTQQYAKTNVVFVSSDYTSVPTELFDIKKKTELFNFSSIKDNTFTLVNEIPRYGFNTIYKVEEDVYEFLLRSLYNPQFFHHTTPLISLLDGNAKTVSLYSKLYVNVEADMIDILCFSGNDLLLAQTHEGLTTSEQTYLILKIWESLELDQMKDQLLVAGNLEEVVIDTARDYIKNIERLASPSEVFLWHKDAQKAPLDLISLSL